MHASFTSWFHAFSLYMTATEMRILIFLCLIVLEICINVEGEDVSGAGTPMGLRWSYRLVSDSWRATGSVQWGNGVLGCSTLFEYTFCSAPSLLVYPLLLDISSPLGALTILMSRFLLRVFAVCGTSFSVN